MSTALRPLVCRHVDLLQNLARMRSVIGRSSSGTEADGDISMSTCRCSQNLAYQVQPQRAPDSDSSRLLMVTMFSGLYCPLQITSFSYWNGLIVQDTSSVHYCSSWWETGFQCRPCKICGLEKNNCRLL